MRYCFTLLALFATLCTTAQLDTSYTTLRYDSVVIYHYNKGNHDEGVAIVDAGRLNAREVISAWRLSRDSAAQISKLLMETSSYGGTQAACYKPHLGIVYWRGGKPVADVCVCLSCNVLSPSLPITAQKQGTQYGDYYTLKGMSDSFRKYLKDMVDKYLK